MIPADAIDKMKTAAVLLPGDGQRINVIGDSQNHQAGWSDDQRPIRLNRAKQYRRSRCAASCAYARG